MALLVFLAGAAGTFIVAADFFSRASRRLRLGFGVGADRAGEFEFALFFLVELAFERVDGGGWGAAGDGRGLSSHGGRMTVGGFVHGSLRL